MIDKKEYTKLVNIINENYQIKLKQKILVYLVILLADMKPTSSLHNQTNSQQPSQVQVLLI